MVYDEDLEGARALGDGGDQDGLLPRAHACQVSDQPQPVEVHVGAARDGDHRLALLHA